jgi:hypothetical protein
MMQKPSLYRCSDSCFGLPGDHDTLTMVTVSLATLPAASDAPDCTTPDCAQAQDMWQMEFNILQRCRLIMMRSSRGEIDNCTYNNGPVYIK